MKAQPFTFLCPVVILLVVFLSSSTEAKTWKLRRDGSLGGNCDARDLSGMREWEGVKPGDEIWVYPGTYGPYKGYGKSSFAGTVWKAKDGKGRDVVAKSDASNPVVIDARGAPQAINFGDGAADGVTLQGFEVRGAGGEGFAAGYGIWLTTRNATVQDCYIRDCKNGGIHVNHAQSNIVLRCVVQDGSIVETGQQNCRANRYEYNTVSNGTIVIHGADSGAVLTGNRCFNKTGEPTMPRMWANYYPSAGGLKACFDLTGYGLPEPLTFAVAVADARGKTIARERTAPDLFKGSLWLGMPKLGEGDYTAEISLTTVNQRKAVAVVTMPFTRKHYPFENNRIGLSHSVIPPFEPIRWRGDDDLLLWGRRITLAKNGFPSQIFNQSIAMLTSPVQLSATIDGNKTTLDAPKLERRNQRQSERAVFSAEASLGKLSVKVSSFLEYDGWYQVRLDFDNPAPVTVDGLELVLPLWPDADTLVVQRNEMRYGYGVLQYEGFAHLRGESYYGAIPQGPGVVWTSENLPGGMAPAIYVGNGDVGLWWYTEDPLILDEALVAQIPPETTGWSFSRERPAIVVERTSAGVDLRLRIASVPKTLPPHYVLEFALLPQPVKPMISHWRRYAWSGRGDQGGTNVWYGQDTPGYRHYGASVDGFELNSDEEYAALRHAFQTGQADPRARFWPHVITPVFNSGRPLALYGSGRCCGLGMREFDTYGGEWLGNTRWQSNADKNFEGWTSIGGIPWDTPRKLSAVGVNFNSSFRDCFIWYHQRLIEKVGVNGAYFDNACMARVWDVDSKTGNRVWKWDTFLRRDLLKRLASMGWEAGREPWWIIHDQPMDFSFVAENFHVEGNFYVPRAGMDQMDWLSPAEFRALTRTKGGPYHKVWTRTPDLEDPNTTPERKQAVLRSLFALCLMHDVGSYLGVPKIVEALDREVDFFDEKACEFIGYWRSSEMVTFSPQDGVHATVYRNGNRRKFVFFLVNASDKEASGSLRFGSLGGRVKRLADLEAHAAALSSQSENVYTGIAIRRHDFRAFVAELE